MTKQGVEDWMALALVVLVILLVGAGIGYSTCHMSQHHFNSCDDGSTRCMQ